MKRYLTFALLALCTTSLAQNRLSDSHTFTLDRGDGIYGKGDTVRLFMNAPAEAACDLRMTTYINGINSRDTLDISGGNDGCIYRAVWNEPTAVMLEFSRKDDPSDKFRIGYVSGAEGFRPGWDAPGDLHRFWKRQIRALRRIPMEVKLTPVPLSPQDSSAYECFAFEINSVDTIPVRGYIARPKDAPRKSLPVVAVLHAAGVAGKWCRSTVNTAMNYTRMGAITIDFNAHGMLNDAPEEYYRELEDGRLKGYSSQIITDHESYYFRTMILRAVRALDYVTKDPAWDGKHLLVTGGSQGGAQSAALAALHGKVSDAVLEVPAMIGTGGMVQGRLSAWPKPLEKNGLDSPAMEIAPYYDCALLLKGVRTNMFVEIGLIDVTCPPAEIFSGINGVKGKKIIRTSPYRPHHADIPAPYKEEWIREVSGPRTDYIKEFIKGASRN